MIWSVAALLIVDELGFVPFERVVESCSSTCWLSVMSGARLS